MTKTNFTLLRNLLSKYQPKEWGVLRNDERELIETELQLINANELELRNMRDFVVSYFGNTMKEKYDRDSMDKLSAITFAIDTVLAHQGYEV